MTHYTITQLVSDGDGTYRRTMCGEGVMPSAKRFKTPETAANFFHNAIAECRDGRGPVEVIENPRDIVGLVKNEPHTVYKAIFPNGDYRLYGIDKHEGRE